MPMQFCHSKKWHAHGPKPNVSYCEKFYTDAQTKADMTNIVQFPAIFAYNLTILS